MDIIDKSSINHNNLGLLFVESITTTSRSEGRLVGYYFLFFNFLFYFFIFFYLFLFFLIISFNFFLIFMGFECRLHPCIYIFILHPLQFTIPFHLPTAAFKLIIRCCFFVVIVRVLLACNYFKA